MFAKLAFRNMKRSARDYLVYILTMTIITALVYAFGSLIFQNELEDLFDLEPVMNAMLILATVFIVIIVAWLINYMIRFMLEKRSSEFGIYLLLGMKKKTVSRLYIRENILLGSFSFCCGIILGILLQQVLVSVMYSMVRMEYHLHITFHYKTFLMTALCYFGCYLLALIRCRHKFRKMNIHALMEARRRNEKIIEKHEKGKQILLSLSIIFILLFWSVFGRLGNTMEVIIFLVGLVLTIYLFYTGISAWIICYIRQKGNAVYKGQNLFLLRQFASKIKTMQFTMGTLTSLFALALLGASIAFMFSEYENTILEEKFPFDVLVYSADTNDDFSDEKAVINAETASAEYYPYHIYTDKNNQVNTWMLTHLEAWGTMYRTADGKPDMAEIEEMLLNEGCYYPYDTYMGLSDYNHLRQMLGYGKKEITSGEYLLQIKPRLYNEVTDAPEDLQIADASGNTFLSCAGIIPDYFSQDGHNGADYVIVVPDEVLERMSPYYSELAVDLKGARPVNLQNKLMELAPENDDMELDMDYINNPDLCSGSDAIITFGLIYLTRESLIPEIKYMLGSIIIPMFYIGLVFVCVAVTVLSVQQLSDSAKYRFRYDVLAKLGLERNQIRCMIIKQLAAYYLCPALFAMVISGKMILFVSKQFVTATGVPAFAGIFFLKSIALFFGIYLVYFIVTYVEFKRNVEEKRR